VSLDINKAILHDKSIQYLPDINLKYNHNFNDLTEEYLEETSLSRRKESLGLRRVE
jgi:hypothetical protein